MTHFFERAADTAAFFPYAAVFIKKAAAAASAVAAASVSHKKTSLHEILVYLMQRGFFVLS